NNIWFASGSIYHWDGNETRLEWLRDIGTGETVEKIWASSQSNIFFVGNEGTIVHYDGVNFEYMESGTDIKLTDIWGVEDQESGEIRVWACGYSSNDGSSVILAYYENQWYTIYERYSGGGNSLSDETVYSPMAGTLWAWEDSDLLWFGGGFGMFALDSALSPSSYEEINIYQEAGYFAYPWRVRGNTPNDLFIVGEYGSVFHYNGINWKWYEDLYQDQSRFRSIAIQSDFAVIVGIDYAPFLDKAYVVRGYR
nr:hypothetical protein [Candidatus Neomarinimicrobiota bacterium]